MLNIDAQGGQRQEAAPRPEGPAPREEEEEEEAPRRQEEPRMLEEQIQLLGRLKLTKAQKHDNPKTNVKHLGNTCFCCPFGRSGGFSWSPLEPSWVASWGTLETILGRHRAILGPPGHILDRLGSM